MKIPIIDLTWENAQKLKKENDWNDHFNLVLWPRILIWLGLKEQFADNKNLKWMIYYTPQNMHNNFISMHIIDPSDKFNFYFQCPMLEKFSFNLYLGDSTYNFFEAHPLLLENKIIKEDEYQIGATSTILPHLILSTPNSKYSRDILYKIDESNYLEITKNDPIINLLTLNFNKFISPIQKIINGEWKLKKPNV